MRVAIVDGYSGGVHLVRELLRRGVECVHVASHERPGRYYTRSFRPGDYAADLGYHPDADAVAARLRGHGVARVLPGAESGVNLADRLAHLTGTPGNTLALTGARRDKHEMALALRLAGLDAPRCAAVTSETAAVAWFEAHGDDEIVVKPLASVTSDRVRFCRSAGEVRAACAAVLDHPNVLGFANAGALVEESLAGAEYYVNTVSVGGTHVIAETWRYTKRRTPDGAPVFDFEEPIDPRGPEAAGIHEYSRAALTALGVSEGASHLELMLTPRGPVLIDPGVRLGGGIDPAVTERFLGYSHASLLAESVVNPGKIVARAAALPPRWPHPIRYVSLINLAEGVVGDLSWLDRIRGLPTVLSATPTVVAGDVLPRTRDLLSSPGFVYLSAGDPAAIEADYERIRRWEDACPYSSSAAFAST